MSQQPEALEDLRAFQRVVVVSGAGLSAASGLATYRQNGSGWTDQRLERISRASRYGNHLPELWQWWGRLRQQVQDARPNPAHRSLAAAEARCRQAGGFLLNATQNVDALLAEAGCEGLVELHGSIRRSRCLRRSCSPAWNDTSIPDPGQVPACPTCGRPARPDIVLFGERLLAAHLRHVKTRIRQADLLIYAGTSGTVWPTRDLIAHARSDALRILVNQQQWDQPHPDFDHTILAPAEVALPHLIG